MTTTDTDTDTDAPPASLVDALARVQADITAVQKLGEATEGGRYSFRRIDDLLAALHPILARHGVLIVPTEQEVVAHVQPVPGRKESWSSLTLRVTYVAVCGACPGESMRFVGIGVGLDNGDKGPGKALSYAYKSAVSQLFSIPTDDPAMDAEMTPEDPPDYVAPAVVADLKLRAKQLGEPWRTQLRDELGDLGLLPAGRLPSRLTLDGAAAWSQALRRVEHEAGTEPFTVDTDADLAADVAEQESQEGAA